MIEREKNSLWSEISCFVLQHRNPLWNRNFSSSNLNQISIGPGTIVEIKPGSAGDTFHFLLLYPGSRQLGVSGAKHIWSPYYNNIGGTILYIFNTFDSLLQIGGKPISVNYETITILRYWRCLLLSVGSSIIVSVIYYANNALEEECSLIQFISLIYLYLLFWRILEVSSMRELSNFFKFKFFRIN